MALDKSKLQNVVVDETASRLELRVAVVASATLDLDVDVSFAC